MDVVLLQRLRSRLLAADISLDRLLPYLVSDVLDHSDLEMLGKENTTHAKLVKLLDVIVPSKHPSALQRLCSALDATYPHVFSDLYSPSHNASNSHNGHNVPGNTHNNHNAPSGHGGMSHSSSTSYDGSHGQSHHHQPQSYGGSPSHSASIGSPSHGTASVTPPPPQHRHSGSSGSAGSHPGSSSGAGSGHQPSSMTSLGSQPVNVLVSKDPLRPVDGKEPGSRPSPKPTPPPVDQPAGGGSHLSSRSITFSPSRTPSFQEYDINRNSPRPPQTPPHAVNTQHVVNTQSHAGNTQQHTANSQQHTPNSHDVNRNSPRLPQTPPHQSNTTPHSITPSSHGGGATSTHNTPTTHLIHSHSPLPQQPPPHSHQVPPHSQQAPPHSQQVPPHSQQAPPHSQQVPPHSQQAPPLPQSAPPGMQNLPHNFAHISLQNSVNMHHAHVHTNQSPQLHSNAQLMQINQSHLHTNPPHLHTNTHLHHPALPLSSTPSPIPSMQPIFHNVPPSHNSNIHNVSQYPTVAVSQFGSAPPLPASAPPSAPPLTALKTGGAVDGKHQDRAEGQKALSRDYEWLRTQCELAMAELRNLKMGQADLIRKCDNAASEAETYRQHCNQLKEKNDSVVGENQRLRSRLSELSAVNQRLETEVSDLVTLRERDKAEMTELRQQQRDVMSDTGSSEVLTMYNSEVDKYERLRQEHDDVRNKFRETFSQLTAANTKMAAIADDNAALRKTLDEVETEKKAALRDQHKLRQHLTSAIQAAQYDREELEKALQRAKMERDTIEKEHMKRTTKMQGERDAVLQEYHLVMSERSGVLKDKETLENQLESTRRKLELSEKERKLLSEEVESLRREGSSKARKHDKYNDDSDGFKLERGPERHSSERYKAVAERASKDAAKEIDSLRRENDRLNAEIKDTKQELSEAKRTWDNVFAELEKIVHEREGIRKLCDSLRHERDRSLSSMMEALKESDELKKQRSEAQRELKEIREKYEALLEAEAARKSSPLHSGAPQTQSRDSAIDMTTTGGDSSSSSDTERVHVHITGVVSGDLGVDLVGGTDDPQMPNDPAIYVASVHPDGPAAGKLRPNDHIVKINHVDVTSVEKKVALQAARDSGGVVSMVVRRRRRKPPGVRTPHAVHIHLQGESDSGILVESGLYVSRILPGTPAARDGSVALGDRILTVNGHPTDTMAAGELMAMLGENHDVTLHVIKYCVSHPGSSIISTSSVSSGNMRSGSSPSSPHTTSRWNEHGTYSSPEHVSYHHSAGVLKTSGSQTDSLDSSSGGGALPSARSRGRVLPSPPGHRSYGERPSSRERLMGDTKPGKYFRERKSRDSSGESPDKGDSVWDKAKKVITRPFHPTERSERDAKAKSSGAASSVSAAFTHATSEQEVIAGLDEILNQHDRRGGGAGAGGGGDRHMGGAVRKRRSRDKDAGAAETGTWPKCRSFREGGSGGGSGRKERPQLGDMLGSGYSATVSGADRSESFSRSASIKHSPQHSHQSSDASQCSVKYNPQYNPNSTQSTQFNQNTSQSTQYNNNTHSQQYNTQSSSMQQYNSGNTAVSQQYSINSTQPGSTTQVTTAITFTSSTFTPHQPITNRQPGYNQNSTSLNQSNQSAFTQTSFKQTGGNQLQTGFSPIQSGFSPTSTSHSGYSESGYSQNQSGSSKSGYNSHGSGYSGVSQSQTGYGHSQGYGQQHGSPSKTSQSTPPAKPPPPNFDRVKQKPPTATSLTTTSSGQQQSQSMDYSPFPDYTVVSAHGTGKYSRPQRSRPRPDRPNSAPSRSRQQRKEQAALLHGSATPPTTLDLPHPILTPRPLPPGTYSAGLSPSLPPGGSSKSSLSSLGSLTSPLSPTPRSADKCYDKPPSMPQSSLRSVLPSNQLVPSCSASLIHSARYTPGLTAKALVSPPPYSLDMEANRLYSPSPSQQSSSGTGLDSGSEFPLSSRGGGTTGGAGGMSDGAATFPYRRHHHGMPPGAPRVPSNPSVMSSSGMSNSSCEGRLSERSSPISPFMPVVPADYQHSARNSNSLPTHNRRPCAGETRTIRIEKSSEPLGIQINQVAGGRSGGIFVSSVSDNSLAKEAGIQVGDQLLDVCGINMRNATYPSAASVLRQCEGSIVMLVQYNPNKYRRRRTGEPGGSSSDSDDGDEVSSSGDHDEDDLDMAGGGHTPSSSRTQSHRISNDTITPDTISPQTLSPTLSPAHAAGKSTTAPEAETSASLPPPCEPRFVILKKQQSHDNLGFNLIGGNAVGIFVHNVEKDSIASGPKGLRCGDQILEFNGINFRSVTAEQAALEIGRPAERGAVLAQYNIAKYQKIQDQPGDALYVRVLFDRVAEVAGELTFRKGDVLFVDSTLYQNQLGVWRAWLVDDHGNKLQCGTVPSKAKLEEDLQLRRSNSDMGGGEDGDRRRNSASSARRSFFRRRSGASSGAGASGSKHQRNNSKDSRELHAASDNSINSDAGNSGVAFDDDLHPYERVERLDSAVWRPVLILAPLAEQLIAKLTSESPDKFCKCEPEILKASISFLETGQNAGDFVDFRSREDAGDGSYECITLQSVKEIIDKGRHCMLSCNPAAIETLHKVHIYPIVLFIKHKSAKQIREVKDTRFLPEKLSSKVAKDVFDTYSEYETKYRRYFSDVIQGGNLAFMCYKIKAAIDKEQKKTIWVPSGAL